MHVLEIEQLPCQEKQQRDLTGSPSTRSRAHGARKYAILIHSRACIYYLKERLQCVDSVETSVLQLRCTWPTTLGAFRAMCSRRDVLGSLWIPGDPSYIRASAISPRSKRHKRLGAGLGFAQRLVLRLGSRPSGSFRYRRTRGSSPGRASGGGSPTASTNHYSVTHASPSAGAWYRTPYSHAAGRFSSSMTSNLPL